MVARVVISLNEPGFADRVASVLNACGFDSAALPDSMVALSALEAANRVELLVTCCDHGPGKPNGLSLALMARMRKPGIKVLFVGPPELASKVEGVGAFIASPVTEEGIVGAATRLVTSDPQVSDR
jgi:hypothetical protein